MVLHALVGPRRGSLTWYRRRLRTKIRWGLVAAAALAIGVTCAEPYARLMAPYYAAIARWIAVGHPWTVVSVGVVPGSKSPSAELRLVGEVRRAPGDARPAARVATYVQVGEAVETPIVFWALLLAWPAPMRRRVVSIAIGLPLFLGLEAITTAVQLVHSMAQASAMLAGEQNPITLWERWSRFLEAGGQFALAVAFAVGVASRGGVGAPSAKTFPVGHGNPRV
jgi:hypothetical protein